MLSSDWSVGLSTLLQSGDLEEDAEPQRECVCVCEYD